MSYAIEFSHEAASDLDALYQSNRRLFRRVFGTIQSLGDSPREGKPLVGNHRGELSLRVGTYRIIYELDSFHETLPILTIKHGKHAY